MVHLCRISCALAGWLIAYSPSFAATIDANPNNYLEKVKELKAGDILSLKPGTYSHGLAIHNLHGEKNREITITGPTTGRATFIARADHNTVSIKNSGFVILKNLEFNGNNKPVDAIKAEGHAQFAHHITLENLTIRGHGYDQQTVGISTKCPAWNWIIRDNTIVGAGTGMYLGNSDGTAPFIAGIIEHNLIADTRGYNIEIKHQIKRPSVPNMPVGDNKTLIRHNVFSKDKGGSKDDLARPNVLVGHWPLQGPGVEDAYEIYGNVFYQNDHEALFQGEGNLALYNNIFINRNGNAIVLKAHHDWPRKIYLFNNTILVHERGITIYAAYPDFPQIIAGNAIFATLPMKGGKQKENIINTYGSAALYLNNPTAPLGKMDLYPKKDKLQSTPLEQIDLRQFTDANKDFNGGPKDSRYRGAYSGEGKNPGWIIKLTKKPRPQPKQKF